MIETTLTKLRQHTRDYFDAVDNGEIIRVSRYGKPVAEVRPINSDQIPSWKKPGPRLEIDGVKLSRAIMEERKER